MFWLDPRVTCPRHALAGDRDHVKAVLRVNGGACPKTDILGRASKLEVKAAHQKRWSCEEGGRRLELAGGAREQSRNEVDTS